MQTRVTLRKHKECKKEAQKSLQTKVEQTAHNLQASILAIMHNELFRV